MKTYPVIVSFFIGISIINPVIGCPLGCNETYEALQSGKYIDIKKHVNDPTCKNMFFLCQKNNNTLLHAACRRYNMELIDAIVGLAKINNQAEFLDKRNNLGEDCLVNMCQSIIPSMGRLSKIDNILRKLPPSLEYNGTSICYICAKALTEKQMNKLLAHIKDTHGPKAVTNCICSKNETNGDNAFLESCKHGRTSAMALAKSNYTCDSVLNSTNSKGQRCLHYLTGKLTKSGENQEVLGYVLNKVKSSRDSQNVNPCLQPDNEGNTPLENACHNRQGEAVDECLEDDTVDINIPTKKENTNSKSIRQECCKLADSEIIERICKHRNEEVTDKSCIEGIIMGKDNVNAVGMADKIRTYTEKCQKMQFKHFPTVMVELCELKNEKAIETFCENVPEETVTQLCLKKNKEGQTALMHCTKHEDAKAKFVPELIKCCRSALNETDKYGKPVMLHLVEMKHCHLARDCASHCADPHQEDDNGESAASKAKTLCSEPIDTGKKHCIVQVGNEGFKELNEGDTIMNGNVKQKCTEFCEMETVTGRMLEEERRINMCKKTCRTVHQPVCGNNGIVYPNRCHLRNDACRNRMIVEVPCAYEHRSCAWHGTESRDKVRRYEHCQEMVCDQSNMWIKTGRISENCDPKANIVTMELLL